MALLTCPTCGKAFAPSQVNLALGVASCDVCDQVHDLSQRRVQRTAVQRTAVDPEGLLVVEGDSPSVSYAWRGWVLLFLVFWCVVWDGAMLLTIGASLSEGQLETLAFSSLHILAGLGVTYFTLGMALNRTEVRLSGSELSVSHGPLPWRGSRTLSRSEIDQIYVIEDRGSKGGRTYSVHARVAPGHPVRLVHGLASAGRARFIEDWLERKLALTDAPVSGEHT